MKGINVKKIAALAIGALFVGSAAVSASKLMYEDTTLVSDSGVPQVSVLIPGASAAAMTDGVAGARIASKLAAESYKEVIYTAELSGTAVCGAGEGAEGACPVTDKSVSMTITSPGITGVYTIDTAIYDIFDEQVGNREGNLGTPVDAYDGDEHKDDATPFFETAGDMDLLYKIGSDFTPFADNKFSVRSISVTQTQAAWVRGRTMIDTDSDPYARISGIGYSVKFWSDTKVGLPLCTDKKNNDWGYCLGDEVAGDLDITKQIANKRVKINFLGGEWIISDMQRDLTDDEVEDEDTRYRGGSVTLAKEASYGTISIGEKLSTSDYYIQLDDISTGTGANFQHPAIVSLIDKATGEVIEQTQVLPGTSQDVGPNAEVRVHVYQTAPGITLTSKWAEVAVYEEEWELNDGDEINTDNEDWEVYIYWKNKNADATDVYGDNEDNLREILLWNDDSFDLKEGEVASIVDDPSYYEFKYNGLDSETRTTVSFKIAKESFKGCGIGAGGADDYFNDPADGAQVEFLVIEANKNYEFQGTTDGSTDTAEDGYKIVYDITGGDPSVYSTLGDLWVYDSSDRCFDFDVNVVDGNDAAYKFDAVGRNGRLVIFNEDLSGAGDEDIGIALIEEVGEIESTDDTAAFHFYLHYEVADTDWDFQHTATDTDGNLHYETGYDLFGIGTYTGTGFATGDMTEVDEEVQKGFVSLRGSKVATTTSERYELDLALSEANMVFTFATAGSTADPNTATWLAHEGDSEVFGDTTITVDTITCTTGACTVSGAGTAGCAYTGGLEAVISGEGAASVAGMAPGTVNPSSLIMLDTEGASLSGNFVSVAGPVVNTVTARELTGANAHDFNAQAVLVKQIAPGKIIVAGRDAADTLTAADQFIAAMQRV